MCGTRTFGSLPLILSCSQVPHLPQGISSPSRWEVGATSLFSTAEWPWSSPYKRPCRASAPQTLEPAGQEHEKVESWAQQEPGLVLQCAPGSCLLSRLASLPLHQLCEPLDSCQWIPFLLQMILVGFWWLQPRPLADSGTNLMVNESWDQGDIIVSISGGSAASISGSVVLLFIARVTKRLSILI